uniref:Uncharacterized protein n=1 Tax=Brassica oleracea TaxID=3712 RepID=A0A3P6DUE2_BRAOL|nr:unnamed protein product [Brassica oleracea]
MGHDNVAPKVEFSDHSIDPEEVDANWTSRGEVKYPKPGTWHPALFCANSVEGFPSRNCPNGLDAIQSFCRVPESVEFHLPVAEEVADSLPDGYFTCFEPDLPVEEGKDPSMDGFANKGCFSENLLGDYFNGEPIDLDEVLGSNLPTTEGGSDKGAEFTKASRLVNGGLLMMNRALDASNQETRMAQFGADKADKEIARMREELECSRRWEGELVTREIHRAYRRGKREMAEVMKNHRA